jgi:uncharacterized protein
MRNNSPNVDQLQIGFSSLTPFLLITFGLAWGIFALFIFLPAQMIRMFGEITGQHPLFFLAVWTPGIAAFVVVLRRAGFSGLKRFLSRLMLWRTSMSWYAFLVFGIPFLFFCGSALKGNIFAEPFPVTSISALLTALAFTAIKGPVEEFGWRGLALPLLQERFSPFWAGLILGVIWGVWHVPAFLLSGTPQSVWSFTPFFAGSIAMSVIMAALFNASRGSILLPAIFHFQANNPIWPDAQPYDTLFFVAAALVVVWFSRKAMFSRQGSFTEVIPQNSSQRCPGNLRNAKGVGP